MTSDPYPQQQGDAYSGQALLRRKKQAPKTSLGELKPKQKHSQILIQGTAENKIM